MFTGSCEKFMPNLPLVKVLFLCQDKPTKWIGLAVYELIVFKVAEKWVTSMVIHGKN